MNLFHVMSVLQYLKMTFTYHISHILINIKYVPHDKFTYFIITLNPCLSAQSSAQLKVSKNYYIKFSFYTETLRDIFWIVVKIEMYLKCVGHTAHCPHFK